MQKWGGLATLWLLLITSTMIVRVSGDFVCTESCPTLTPRYVSLSRAGLSQHGALAGFCLSKNSGWSKFTIHQGVEGRVEARIIRLRGLESVVRSPSGGPYDALQTAQRGLWRSSSPNQPQSHFVITIGIRWQRERRHFAIDEMKMTKNCRVIQRLLLLGAVGKGPSRFHALA